MQNSQNIFNFYRANSARFIETYLDHGAIDNAALEIIEDASETIAPLIYDLFDNHRRYELAAVVNALITRDQIKFAGYNAHYIERATIAQKFYFDIEYTREGINRDEYTERLSGWVFDLELNIIVPVDVLEKILKNHINSIL